MTSCRNHQKKEMIKARFDGRVAIITGAAGGIGKEIEVRLAAERGVPVIADFDLKAAEATAAKIR